MQLQTWQDWVAWAGVVIPLASLAWAAVMHVRLGQRQARSQEFDQLFKVMELIGSHSGNQPSQMAAIFELRNYPNYKNLILRMCDTLPISGSASAVAAIKNELESTAKFLQGDENV
jgi:hypothetical protein